MLDATETRRGELGPERAVLAVEQLGAVELVDDEQPLRQQRVGAGQCRQVARNVLTVVAEQCQHLVRPPGRGLVCVGWRVAGRPWAWGVHPVGPGQQHDPWRRCTSGRVGMSERHPVTLQRLAGFSLPAEGELVAVDVDGTAVAVAVVDGELHAFDDTCPHAGCSLADGELDEQNVVCPCHFARFDVTTGAVVEGPATSGVGVWSVTFTDGTLELEGPRSPAATPDAVSGTPPAPAHSTSVSAASGPDRDITVLIEREHENFRRQFDALQGFSDPDELEQAWTTLAGLLEIHASGEESVLYPNLVRAAGHAAQEAEHAVADHNEIRDSVRAVRQHPVGGDSWWQAVRAAEAVNEDHLQQEERDVLPPFRDSTDRTRREELGRQWLAFHSEHDGARGLNGKDADPQAVLTP